MTSLDDNLGRLCDLSSFWGLSGGLILTGAAYLGLFVSPIYIFPPLLILNLATVFAALFFAVRIGKILIVNSNLPKGMLFSALALVTIFLILWATQCILPVTSRDALIYHLFVPKEWLRLGNLLPLEWHTWSYFPLLKSITYGGLLQMGGEQLTQFYHGLFWIMSCLLSAGVSVQLGISIRSALLASLAAFTTPLCVRLAGEPMADWFLAWYSIIFIHYAVNWWKSPTGTRIWGGSAALGLMLSVKYTGLLAVALMGSGLLLVIVCKKLPLKIKGRELLLLTLPAILIVIPWFGRNWFLTGDPLYPFLGGEHGASEDYAFVGSAPPLVYRHLVYGESWFEIALIPLRMIFAGADGSTRTFDGVLTPIFSALLIPLVTWRSRINSHGPLMGALIAIVCSHILLAPLLHHLVTRYHLAIFGALVPILALGLDVVISAQSAFIRCLVPLLVLSHLYVALNYQWYFTTSRRVYDYLTGSISRTDYLDEFASENIAARFLAEHTDTKARAYLLFTGNRYLLYNREVRGGYASASPFLKLLPQAGGACRLAGSFHGSGITHLLLFERRLLDVVKPELERESTFATEWNNFFSNFAERVAIQEGLSLWKLRSLTPECPVE